MKRTIKLIASRICRWKCSIDRNSAEKDREGTAFRQVGQETLAIKQENGLMADSKAVTPLISIFRGHFYAGCPFWNSHRRKDRENPPLRAVAVVHPWQICLNFTFFPPLDHDCPYRDPWYGKAALNEIGKYVRSCKFDPMIVDTLADIISELD